MPSPCLRPHTTSLLVPLPGFEPGPWRFLRPPPLPIGVEGHGVHGGIRTHTIRPLKTLPLPLGYVDMVDPLGFEPRPRSLKGSCTAVVLEVHGGRYRIRTYETGVAVYPLSKRAHSSSLPTFLVAVGEGFEPSDPSLEVTGLANQRDRPLCQPTKWYAPPATIRDLSG